MLIDRNTLSFFAQPFHRFGKNIIKSVARITAITHRRNAHFQALLTGKPITENHIFKQLTFEMSFYRTLGTNFPSVRRVAMPPSGGVSYYTVRLGSSPHCTR